MTCQLYALCFDASRPRDLAAFWAGVLGRRLSEDPRDGVAVLPADGYGFRLGFFPGDEPKTVANRIHFDLTSTSPENMRETVDRALRLGGRHIDIGQRPEEGHVVLADPDGNEFCVIPPGNAFLAGCGFLGALACDGSQAVGYFWSAALQWPLVWDQDEETAIQSPHGGPKITWGGPPVAPQHGRNRLHFDLVPPPGGDQRAEVDHLLSLGAKLLDPAPHEGGRITMLDPDDNEFCVLTPR
jgi:hypothetical protein